MELERISKVIKAFPKEDWKKAKCPYCFGDIKKCGNWPYFWVECIECGKKINFFSYIDAIEKILDLNRKKLKNFDWANNTEVNSGIY